MRLVGDAWWRTAGTPAGPVTQRLRARGSLVTSDCWGPGAEWLSTRAGEVVGAHDIDAETFDPPPGLIRDLWRSNGSRWRVPRSHNAWECAVAAVLEQKVTGLEAKTAWASLARQFGQSAPGPAPDGMVVFPDPVTVRSIPSWVWRRNGVDRSRSDTIMRLTRVGHVLERLASETADEARRLLTALPGVGAWTYAEVAQRALGDADAVSVGDFHLAADVVYALTGRFGGTDEEMLELLAPYAGHRYRAVRMLELGGPRRPRRGPRLAIPPHRRG